MENLTFGEQVKIILSRKGMTIKQLAELIEERTGKAMSRQNLTQRLGRDNFQEQDMRMIAAILGCPFQLSIFPTEGTEDRQVTEDVMRYANRAKLKDKVVKTEERDMTIGELYQIHEELDELSAEDMSQDDAAEDDIILAEDAEEVPEEAVEDVSEEPEAYEPEYRPEEKKERFRSGGIFLRRKGEDIREVPEPEDAKPVKNPTQRIITPDSKDFQPVIQHDDVKEDLSVGEMNPYTGREYQTNSVRMHPTRIGYVQVYDRKEHKWTDMTEWAFLGYQERKKALLGKDYEPPIYLD